MTSAWAGTPSGAAPFQSTAMSGVSSVSYSGTVTVNVESTGGPPGLPATSLAGQPSTCSKNVQAS